MKKSLFRSAWIAIIFLLSFVTTAKSVDETATLSWPFNLGTEGQTVTYSQGTESYFGADWITLGSNLAYASTKSDFGITFTAFQPFIQNNAVTDNDFVGFNFRPKTGLSFTPKSVTFDCERFGTSGGKIDVVWISAEGTKTTLGTGIIPERNGTGTTHASIDLSTLTFAPSSGNCSLYLYIYALGNTKQVGISNLVLTGQVLGTPVQIPSYKLTTIVSPAGAGSLTNSPVGTEFDEGTVITLTAATRNFGYQFKQWEDANGNVLSATSPYTFSITKDTTVKAVYEALTTYNFNLDILGSKWGVVSLIPAPVGGKYEAGTTVQMSVAPNQVTRFSYWEDSSTATTRTILVDGDKSFSATFDEVPFITGWDFVKQDPKSSRSGDYYSETSNTGMLDIYNQDGTKTSWLSHTASFSPSQSCAYLWTVGSTFMSNRRYWQASFSTKDYSNVVVNSQMAGSYRHYLTQKMQISLDGTNFTDLKTVDISPTIWSDLNDTLPGQYENQDLIYIRWIADTNSELIGNDGDNDGTAITNIFVFADKAVVNDTVPPVLLSTVPTEGSTNATSNGSIVLTFNEKMKAGYGNCTLGSTILTPAFGSKTVTFAYIKLTYNTDYTFTVPAGALTDIAGNPAEGVTINFKTMNRPQPIAKVFDAIVAKDGTGDYGSIVEAIAAVPANRVQPWLIFVKNGVYKGHVDIPVNKPYINMIGQNRDSVIISDGRLSGSSSAYPDSTVYSVDPGATVVVKSANCYFENICFENKFGYDHLSGPQALALYTTNDRIVLNNCWLRSYQDTYLTTYGNATNRHYLKNCLISGAVDFIYGGGDVFFDACTIYCLRSSGGYIVAPSHLSNTNWGYVFSNCTIDGPDASYTTYLGRPWTNSPMTSFFNTKTKIGIYPVGWFEHMGAIPVIFADYNTMDKDGNALDLSHRINKYWYISNGDTIRGTSRKSFTDEEAANYTYEKVTSGIDGWDPRAMIEPTDAPNNVKVSSSGDLSWDTMPYAICYMISKANKVIGFTSSTQYSLLDHSNLAEVKVSAVAESGTLSVATVASVVDGLNEVLIQEPKVSVLAGQIVIDDLKKDDRVILYNLSGQMLTNYTASANSLQLRYTVPCIVKIMSVNGIFAKKVIL